MSPSHIRYARKLAAKVDMQLLCKVQCIVLNVCLGQVLDGVQKAIVQTQLSNLYFHPTDCPQREVGAQQPFTTLPPHVILRGRPLPSICSPDPAPGHTLPAKFCQKRGWTGDAQFTSRQASLNFDMRQLYGNWLQTMQDHDTAGCALNGASPIFPQTNKDICCTPKHKSFGCDFTGIPNGSFTNTGGSVADVVPFMYVGGWPGDFIETHCFLNIPLAWLGQ